MRVTAPGHRIAFAAPHVAAAPGARTLRTVVERYRKHLAPA